MTTIEFFLIFVWGYWTSWWADHIWILVVGGLAVACTITLAVYLDRTSGKREAKREARFEAKLSPRDRDTITTLGNIERPAELHRARFMPPPGLPAEPVWLPVTPPVPGQRPSPTELARPLTPNVTSPAVPDDAPGSGPAAGLVAQTPAPAPNTPGHGGGRPGAADPPGDQNQAASPAAPDPDPAAPMAPGELEALIGRFRAAQGKPALLRPRAPEASDVAASEYAAHAFRPPRDWASDVEETSPWEHPTSWFTLPAIEADAAEVTR